MRVSVPAVEEMTPRQKEVYERIAGRRGRFGGPYAVWIQSPEVCERQEALTAYYRFENDLLPLKLRELVICLTARFWDAQFSWSSHVQPAIDAGIPREAMEAIAAKREPVFTDPGEKAFYQFVMEILRNHYVSDETFKDAEKHFGIKGTVEIVAAVGAFSTVAMVLNTFLVDLKSPPPFADVGTRPYDEAKTHVRKSDGRK
jgi:4-carboxymuconolactone decarboxylase